MCGGGGRGGGGKNLCTREARETRNLCAREARNLCTTLQSCNHRDQQLLQFSVGGCVCVCVCVSGTELRLSWNRLHHSLRYTATKYSLRGQTHPIGSGLRTNESLTSFKTYGSDDCQHGRAKPHTRQPSLRAAPLTKGTTRGPRTNRKTHKTATHAGRQICILKLHKSRGEAVTESGCSNSQDGAVLCLRVFVFFCCCCFKGRVLLI